MINETDLIIAASFIIVFTITGKLVLSRMERELSTQSIIIDQSQWSVTELAKVLIRLDEQIDMAEKRQIYDERSKLSRQIHDSFGYSLKAALVQLDVISEMVSQNAVRKRIGNITEMLRSTLREVRESVTRLRIIPEKDNKVDWPMRWKRLCNLFATCTEVRIKASVGDELRNTPEEIGEAVSKILQESLTNAYRHGRASYIDVVIIWKRELHKILFRVSDDGIGCGHVILGNGLNGINERVENLNGEAKFISLPNRGFDLGVDIPWNGTRV